MLWILAQGGVFYQLVTVKVSKDTQECQTFVNSTARIEKAGKPDKRKEQVKLLGFNS